VVDESGKWNERQRAYPGRSDDTSIKLINRFGKKKATESSEVSRSHSIWKKKKQRRAEHIEEIEHDTYGR
jgi:hypothetical protein